MKTQSSPLPGRNSWRTYTFAIEEGCFVTLKAESRDPPAVHTLPNPTEAFRKKMPVPGYSVKQIFALSYMFLTAAVSLEHLQD